MTLMPGSLAINALAVMLVAGCTIAPPTSPERTTKHAAAFRTTDQLAGVSPPAGGRLPDMAVGSRWKYDVVVRTRTRPQDGSAPWSEWKIVTREREARGMVARVLDDLPYVVVQEFDHYVEPPRTIPASSADPRRRDITGLYHRPSPVIGTSTADPGDPDIARHGGPEARDDLLIPHPARPGDEFVSNRVFHDRNVVEAHEPVRTGLGVIPAVRVRRIAGDNFRPGDGITEWYAPQGRIASHRFQTRVAFGPDHQPLWVEIDSKELLISIVAP